MLDASRLALERDSLIQQVQQLSAQLASVGASATPPSQSLLVPLPSASQLSESFYLELERAERQAERERAERAERQAQAERLHVVQAEREKAERAERTEARLMVAATVGTCVGALTCMCGLGAAIIGASVLLKKA